MNKLSAIVLDCPDPVALASFYSVLTGWDVSSSTADYATISSGSVDLAFQRIEDFTAPAWPSSAKQVHIDVTVSDVAVAEKELLALGATKPSFQPGGGEWTVLADPAGHMFCLVPGGE
ncbi:VOC family protein [Actinocrispum sp. NPDC049592]|uniref:VOC family protein n=1 Tax=Actinocrispum sp. NPDC049592 TaxID=3154835 RepID=UPI00342A31AF